MFNDYRESNTLKNASPEQQQKIISISNKLEQQPIKEQPNENHDIITTIEKIIKNEIIDEGIKPILKEIDSADEKLKTNIKLEVDSLNEITKQSIKQVVSKKKKIVLN